MKSFLLTIAVLAGVLQFGSTAARAQETAAPAGVSATAPASDPKPVLSSDTRWTGVMVLIVFLGFFFPAMVIGPVVRALSGDPDPQPDAHASHDDHGHDSHAAHSHGHGH